MKQNTVLYTGTFIGAGIAAVASLFVRRLFVRGTTKD